MSETQKVPKGSFAAIKMPKPYLDFIKRNNKLAQKVGTLMIGLSDYLDKVKQIRGYLSTPALFEGDLENGTSEELKGFLLAVIENTDGAVLFKDVPEDVQQKIVDKLGGHVELVDTKLDNTTVDLSKQAVSEEASA